MALTNSDWHRTAGIERKLSKTQCVFGIGKVLMLSESESLFLPSCLFVFVELLNKLG